MTSRPPFGKASRAFAATQLAANRVGHGRELFASMRKLVGPAEQGACALFLDEDGVDGHDIDEATR